MRPRVGKPVTGQQGLYQHLIDLLANVTRDLMMSEYDARFPGYGFAQHKGYCTPEHFAALRALGPSPIHRRSFAPVFDAAQLVLAICDLSS